MKRKCKEPHILRMMLGVFMLALVTSLLCVLPCFIKNETLQPVVTLFLFFYFLSFPFVLLITLICEDRDLKKKKIIKRCRKLISKISKFIFGADILFDNDSL
jgi:DMSO/TMAO reductase YedYZ heme-binding membrane subunit